MGYCCIQRMGSTLTLYYLSIFIVEYPCFSLVEYKNSKPVAIEIDYDKINSMT